LPAILWGLRTCLVVALLVLSGSAGGIAAHGARDRTISFYNIHSKETLTIQYMKDGKYLAPAMQQINWILRDWRQDEKTTMDPDLIDLVWEVHNELGSAEPIHIISGYRSRTTNDMLRRTVGGQASQSRHILGKAMDVYFPDVSVKKLRYSALIRERGGVGYYPTSAIPFVHIDTDRVRAWPRLPRAELALLFPSGHTQHVPEEGGSISRGDALKARANNPEMAQQVAEFHSERVRPKTSLQVASLVPSLPQLLALPRRADRPPSRGTDASAADRARLAELAREPPPRLLRAPTPISRRQAAPLQAPSGAGGLALAERTDAGSSPTRARVTFASAPAYDEEHPEELSYRPFPIAPLLTPTVSSDCPDLARLVQGDLGKALELIDERSAPPARLRLSFRAAQLMWAQQFRGEAVDLSAMTRLGSESGEANLTGRRVASEPQ
jgi:uncharacterized protein YcbK (DUF882 family)